MAKTTKPDTAEQPAAQPVAEHPTVEQVTAIACALLQSHGFSVKLRDEQHQAYLVRTAVQIARKINAEVNA
ncbi:MAG: hypothetical protein ACI4OS_02095 [Akkermansia sp.]